MASTTTTCRPGGRAPATLPGPTVTPTRGSARSRTASRSGTTSGSYPTEHHDGHDSSAMRRAVERRAGPVLVDGLWSVTKLAQPAQRTREAREHASTVRAPTSRARGPDQQSFGIRASARCTRPGGAAWGVYFLVPPSGEHGVAPRVAGENWFPPLSSPPIARALPSRPSDAARVQIRGGGLLRNRLLARSSQICIAIAGVRERDDCVFLPGPAAVATAAAMRPPSAHPRWRMLRVQNRATTAGSV